MAIGPIAALTAAAAPGPSYMLAKNIPLGAPDRWDYVVYDDQTGRVYVAHGDRLAAVDPESGKVVGEVQGITGGTHGTAISSSTGQGFTADGRNGKLVAFDLHSLKVTREIPADVDADALALDRVTGHLFVVEGDPESLTVIDPKTDIVVATIKAGEKLEYAVADGQGSIFVAGEEKGDAVRIDARSNSIAARWPLPGCTSPHGIAIDPHGQRLFIGCANAVMVVVDTTSGRNVARLAIGHGNDAVAFDPVRRRVFSSNGRDGTVSAYQQTSPDQYAALPDIRTTISARTMSLDPKTGQLFVAGADTDPNPNPAGHPHVRPGTLRLMIFRPER
jgi:DNA-binding beta-propeller fold protein YncE